MDPERDLLYGVAWNAAWVLESDGHQRSSRAGLDAGCVDGRAWTRTDVWLDRKLHSGHRVLFAASAAFETSCSVGVLRVVDHGRACTLGGKHYEWHWRSLLVVSSALELIAVLLFLSAASHHKRPDGVKGTKKGMEAWMISVLLSTAALTAVVIFNFVECVRLALYGATPSFPHVLDQKYLVLLGWGFLGPVVWGFSARWLPAFLGIDQPRARTLQLALVMDVAGVLAGVSGWLPVATSLFAASAVTVVFALHLIDRPNGRAKVSGIHPSFPYFVRIAYAWLVIAGSMSLWAALADLHGGIWGASRHALTVGFAATMVFSIGPRILPHFCGVTRLFSTRLMFAALLLLQVGCTLRVSSEPLAYEGFSSFAWRVLPVSGMLELTAVLIFAANIAATIALGRPAFAGADQGQAAAA